MNTQYLNTTGLNKTKSHGYIVTIGAEGSGQSGGGRKADDVAIDGEVPRRRLMTTKQAAEYCGLAKNTLEKMRLYGRKNDNSPRFCKLGSAVRYHPDDLDAWIARNRAITTSEYDPSN